jgi:hypothetical protein
MKKSALVLLIVLWPVTAYSSLITYDISFTVLAANLFQRLYGDISVRTHFVQNTEGNPFFQGGFGLGGHYAIQGNVRPSLSELMFISPTNIRLFFTDPAGFVRIDLLYDTPLGPFPFASPLPKPYRLATFFGSELHHLCIPNGGCSLGTSGDQTFAGEGFSFSAAVALPEPPTVLLMVSGLLLIWVANLTAKTSSQTNE